MNRVEWVSKFGLTCDGFAIPERCYDFQNRFDAGVIYHYKIESNGNWVNLELEDHNTFSIIYTIGKNKHSKLFDNVTAACAEYNRLMEKANKIYYNMCKEQFFAGIDNSSKKVFLDDIRNPKDSSFAVLRSPDEFKDFIIMMGCPGYISFDHDLGSDVESGYDCLQWLIERDLRNNKTFIPKDFEINVHSANPVGKENIEKLWISYKNFKANF